MATERLEKIIGEHFGIELVVVDRFGRNREPQLVSHPREVVSPEGHFAQKLIERWGVVAAIEDGEDTSGRAKCRLQTPQELVARAFETARLVYQELHTRELIAHLPSYPEIMSALDEPPTPMTGEV